MSSREPEGRPPRFGLLDGFVFHLPLPGHDGLQPVSPGQLRRRLRKRGRWGSEEAGRPEEKGGGKRFCLREEAENDDAPNVGAGGEGADDAEEGVCANPSDREEGAELDGAMGASGLVVHAGKEPRGGESIDGDAAGAELLTGSDGRPTPAGSHAAGPVAEGVLQEHKLQYKPPAEPAFGEEFVSADDADPSSPEPEGRSPTLSGEESARERQSNEGSSDDGGAEVRGDDANDVAVAGQPVGGQSASSPGPGEGDSCAAGGETPSQKDDGEQQEVEFNTSLEVDGSVEQEQLGEQQVEKEGDNGEGVAGLRKWHAAREPPAVSSSLKAELERARARKQKAREDKAPLSQPTTLQRRPPPWPMHLPPDRATFSQPTTLQRGPPPCPLHLNKGRWTAEEHRLFRQGLEQHGKDWKKISTLVGSRDPTQVRTHAQKCLGKTRKPPNDEEQNKLYMEQRVDSLKVAGLRDEVVRRGLGTEGRKLVLRRSRRAKGGEAFTKKRKISATAASKPLRKAAGSISLGTAQANLEAGLGLALLFVDFVQEVWPSIIYLECARDRTSRRIPRTPGSISSVFANNWSESVQMAIVDFDSSQYLLKAYRSANLEVEGKVLFGMTDEQIEDDTIALLKMRYPVQIVAEVLRERAEMVLQLTEAGEDRAEAEAIVDAALIGRHSSSSRSIVKKIILERAVRVLVLTWNRHQLRWSANCFYAKECMLLTTLAKVPKQSKKIELPAAHFPGPKEGESVKRRICPGAKNKLGACTNDSPMDIDSNLLVCLSMPALIHTNAARDNSKHIKEDEATQKEYCTVAMEGSTRILRKVHASTTKSGEGGSVQTTFSYHVSRSNSASTSEPASKPDCNCKVCSKRLTENYYTVKQHRFGQIVASHYGVGDPIDGFNPASLEQALARLKDLEKIAREGGNVGAYETFLKKVKNQFGCDTDHCVGRLEEIYNSIYATFPCSHSMNMALAWIRIIVGDWCYGLSVLKYEGGNA